MMYTSDYLVRPDAVDSLDKPKKKQIPEKVNTLPQNSRLSTNFDYFKQSVEQEDGYEFDSNRASRYQQAMHRMPKARDSELLAMQELLIDLHLTSCQKIVDIGAGHGFATRALTDALAPGGIVHGIDNSPYMVRQIPSHPLIRTAVAELDDIDIASNTVDLVVTLASFHHVQHKSIVLREIKRLLRPGGYLLIADVNEGTATQQFFDHVVRQFCTTGHDVDFLDEDWARILAKRSGLKHIQSTIKSTNWVFSDDIAMTDYVRDLFSLEITLNDLQLLLEKWLKPKGEVPQSACILPWELGFHVFRCPD